MTQQSAFVYDSDVSSIQECYKIMNSIKCETNKLKRKQYDIENKAPVMMAKVAMNCWTRTKEEIVRLHDLLKITNDYAVSQHDYTEKLQKQLRDLLLKVEVQGQVMKDILDDDTHLRVETHTRLDTQEKELKLLRTSQPMVLQILTALESKVMDCNDLVHKVKVQAQEIVELQKRKTTHLQTRFDAMENTIILLQGRVNIKEAGKLSFVSAYYVIFIGKIYK
jgi:hypothetical protein